MLYSVLIYDSESLIETFSEEHDRQIIEAHQAFQDRARQDGKLGPVARLMPTSAAVCLKPTAPNDPSPAGDQAGRRTQEKTMVLDGPFAETKEQLVGFYVIEADSLEQAIERARGLPLTSGCHEIRPIQWFDPGALG